MANAASDCHAVFFRGAEAVPERRCLAFEFTLQHHLAWLRSGLGHLFTSHALRSAEKALGLGNCRMDILRANAADGSTHEAGSETVIAESSREIIAMLGISRRMRDLPFRRDAARWLVVSLAVSLAGAGGAVRLMIDEARLACQASAHDDVAHSTPSTPGAVRKCC